MKRWSNADFKYFKDRVMHWRRAFGLTDWDVVVKMGEMRETDIGAAVRAAHDSRLAEVILCAAMNEEASRPNNRETLDLWALHEVLHILMTEYRWYTVHTEKEKVDALEHQVIRAIENVLLGDDR